MKKYTDQYRGEMPQYKVGQKVWLNSENLGLGRPSKKLTDRRLRPYPILEIVSSHAIRLKLPSTMRIHPVVNITWVTPYHAPTIEGQSTEEPPLIVIRGEEEYEVEEVLNSRMRGRRFEYLVKWKGYTDEHNTWEPASNLTNSKEAVTKYHKKHPSAPRQIAAFSEINFRPYKNYMETSTAKIEEIEENSDDSKTAVSAESFGMKDLNEGAVSEFHNFPSTDKIR
jgi:hypothetical protein